jgi:predicted RNA-binding Zn ribbon-like protein
VDPVTIPLVGEPLAVDFVNTVVQPPIGAERDLLADPDSFRAWLDEEGDRLDAPGGEVDLAALRDLRVHVARALDAARRGRRPDAASLAALTAAQRAAPAYRVLRWDRTQVTGRVHRDADATASLLAVLAEAATDLLTDPAVKKLRQCEGPGCRLLFLPTHPRRRWCSPALCGNRVRVARYYQRHKARATR